QRARLGQQDLRGPLAHKDRRAQRVPVLCLRWPSAISRGGSYIPTAASLLWGACPRTFRRSPPCPWAALVFSRSLPRWRPLATPCSAREEPTCTSASCATATVGCSAAT